MSVRVENSTNADGMGVIRVLDDDGQVLALALEWVDSTHSGDTFWTLTVMDPDAPSDRAPSFRTRDGAQKWAEYVAGLVTYARAVTA